MWRFASAADTAAFERAWQQVATIHDTMSRVFTVAAEEGITPAIAADRIAERRLTANSRNQDS